MSVMKFSGVDVSVVVNNFVFNTWQESRQTTTTATEQFGVLVGSKSYDDNSFWIDP